MRIIQYRCRYSGSIEMLFKKNAEEKKKREIGKEKEKKRESRKKKKVDGQGNFQVVGKRF